MTHSTLFLAVGKRSRPKLDMIHSGGSATMDFQNSPQKNFGKVQDQNLKTPPEIPTSPQTKNWMSGIEQLQSRDRARHLNEVRQKVNMTQEQVSGISCIGCHTSHLTETGAVGQASRDF